MGKAVIPLRVCLTNPQHSPELEVRSSTLTQALTGHMTDKDPLIGQLKVHNMRNTNFRLFCVLLQVSIELVGMEKFSRPPKIITPPSEAVTTLKLSESKPNTHSKCTQFYCVQLMSLYV